MDSKEPILLENILVILTVICVATFLWLMIKAGCIMYDRHHKHLIREAIIEAHKQMEATDATP